MYAHFCVGTAATPREVSKLDGCSSNSIYHCCYGRNSSTPTAFSIVRLRGTILYKSRTFFASGETLCLSLAHSVNFYFIDESEPSLVFARVALLVYLGLRQGTARSESPHTTEAEPEVCFIDTEACQARNLNSSHTRLGERLYLVRWSFLRNRISHNPISFPK